MNISQSFFTYKMAAKISGVGMEQNNVTLCVQYRAVFCCAMQLKYIQTFWNQIFVVMGPWLLEFRAAVMGVGIHMGMGMGCVLGLWWIPMGLWGFC